MEYLRAAISLLSLIKNTNTASLSNMEKVKEEPNLMRISSKNKPIRDIKMQNYSNEFVMNTLNKHPKSDAFIITDLVSTTLEGKQLTYLLYKAYHRKLESGIVFFQLLEKDTLARKGPLQFSNMEENIFYQIDAPNIEESSCNAMETDKVIDNGKSIVFFIGHMNEQRLLYDIQRLIFDTVNNIRKHPKLNFEFIVQIAHYGGTPSQELKEKVQKIAEYTQKYIYPEYPNASFEFEYEPDATLN